MKKLLLTFCLALSSLPTWGWGGGHDTVVRCVLEKLPGEYRARFRPEWKNIYLQVAHLPDRCGLDRVKESERAWFTEHLGLKDDSFVFHRAEYVFGEVERMVEAIRRADDYSLFVYLASVSHSLADPVACNHDPLVHVLTYNWGAESEMKVLPKSGRPLPVDFDFVERDAVTKDVLARRLADLKVPEVPSTLTRERLFAEIAAWEVKALDVCSAASDRIVSEGSKYMSSGDEAAERAAADALCDLGLYAVRKTLYVFAAARKFAAETSPAVDPKDYVRIAKTAADEARKEVVRRPLANDAWARPYLPDGDRPCRFAVLYDPTAHMDRSTFLPMGRVLGCQVVGSLRKLRPDLNAGILDARVFAAKGFTATDASLPSVTDASRVAPSVTDASRVARTTPEVSSPHSTTLMVFGRVNGYGGFDVNGFYRQLERFVQAGGKLIWVEGRPPESLFGRDLTVTMSDGGRRDGYCRPAYPCGGANELMDCSFAWIGGGTERVWKYRRKPVGKAGWFWHGSPWTFDRTRLPKDVEPLTELRAPSANWLTGVRRGRVTYLPMNALLPYCLTEETPSFNPFFLCLDSAGESMLVDLLK